MRITILAVGRLKSGPEAELCDDYLDRFRKAGRALGFRSIDLIEVESGGGLDAEAERLIAKLPQGAHAIRLDEHGREYRSKAFSRYIAELRDRGVPDLVFVARLRARLRGHSSVRACARNPKLGTYFPVLNRYA